MLLVGLWLLCVVWRMVLLIGGLCLLNVVRCHSARCMFHVGCCVLFVVMCVLIIDCGVVVYSVSVVVLVFVVCCLSFGV